MHIYIIMLLTSLLIAFLSDKIENKKLKIACVILSWVPFILVSALRYDVGTDYYYRYVPDFRTILHGGDVGNLEIGFKLIVKLCTLITDDYQIIFVISSTIIIYLYMSTIFKDSKNKILSIALFFLGGFFFQSLNIVRQYIAIGIIFYSYKYLFEDGKKQYYFLLGVAIACTMHITSIVCLVMFFIKDKEIFNLRNTVILFVLVLLLKGPVIDLARDIIANTRFSVYLGNAYDKGNMRKLTILVNTLLYLFMYVLYKLKKDNNKDKIEKRDLFYLNIQGLCLIFILLSSEFLLFFRVAYFFMIYQIVSIPYFIMTSDIKMIRDKIPNYERVLSTGMVFCFAVVLCYTNILHNDEEVSPYKSIFERDPNWRQIEDEKDAEAERKKQEEERRRNNYEIDGKFIIKDGKIIRFKKV